MTQIKSIYIMLNAQQGVVLNGGFYEKFAEILEDSLCLKCSEMEGRIV